METVLDYPGELNIITKSPYRGEAGRSESQREDVTTEAEVKEDKR